MKYLEALGIRPGHDVAHRNFADPKQFEPERFFDDARTLLTKATPIILDKVAPKLEEYPGRWNPGGFMVFPLGLTDDDSSLRLHVSAAGMPRDILCGPFIHNHGWHLASRILAGNYSDTIFQLEMQHPSTQVDPETNVWRRYETRRNPGGRDDLITDGTVVKAVPVLNREIPAGNFHTIEAVTVYHIPTTPPEQLAATLVLDSPAFVGTTYVLLDNSAGTPMERQRRELERDNIELAKEQLKNTAGF